MKKILSIASETSILLRRDQIFQPLAVIVGAAIAIAIFATDWSIEDRSLVYHNIIAFVFQMSGSIIALIWGVKIIADAKVDGSIEQSLTRPISRGQWLLGRLLGLGASLFILNIAVGIIWRTGAYIYDIHTVVSWFTISMVQTLFLWIIVGGLAVFVSSFTGPGTALFASASLWLLGLVSKPISQGLTGQSFENLRIFTTQIANIWTLSPFVPEPYGEILSVPLRQIYAGYGLCMISLLYVVSSIISKSKDINS